MNMISYSFIEYIIQYCHLKNSLTTSEERVASVGGRLVVLEDRSTIFTNVRGSLLYQSTRRFPAEWSYVFSYEHETINYFVSGKIMFISS